MPIRRSVLFARVILGMVLSLTQSPGEAAAGAASPFDLQAMRDLGAAPEEDLAVRLESEVIGSYSVPGFLQVKGGGFTSSTMTFSALRVVYPTGTVIIDTALDETLARRLFKGSTVDQAAYDRLQEAMKNSQAIVLTHEHPDHAGGLPRSPYLKELIPRLLMTPEQLAGPSVAQSGFDPGALDKVVPLAFEKLHRVAPGLVLAKLPGHSPGTLLIYLRLAGGREFLCVGDIVWHMDGITRQRQKNRAASWLIREDRKLVREQIRALHDLVEVRKDPIQVIVAHDSGQLAHYISAGWITRGFGVGSAEGVEREEAAGTAPAGQ